MDDILKQRAKLFDPQSNEVREPLLEKTQTLRQNNNNNNDNNHTNNNNNNNYRNYVNNEQILRVRQSQVNSYNESKSTFKQIFQSKSVIGLSILAAAILAIVVYVLVVYK